MSPKEAFAVTIKQLRTEKKFAQERLAQEAELSLTSMARIELSQQEVKLGTLLRLAKALDLTGSELVALVEVALRRRK